MFLLINSFLLSFFFLSTEHDFSTYSASNIASSSIAASLSGLNWHSKSRISIYDLVDKLAELSESDSVSIIYNKIIIINSLHETSIKIASRLIELWGMKFLLLFIN